MDDVTESAQHMGRVPERSSTTTLQTHLSFGRNPKDDLAFEERLLGQDGSGHAHLFVYAWSDPVLVLGRGQHNEEVSRSACEREEIPVIKRRSGGTAVLHNRTLNIGLVLPSRHEWVGSIRGLYERFISPIAAALQAQGIAAIPMSRPMEGPRERTPICFESHTEDTLLLNHKKVFGSAQRRLRGSILIHGTLVVHLNTPQQSRVFGVPESRIDRIMTSIPSGHDVEALAEGIVDGLASALHMTPKRHPRLLRSG